MGTFSLQREKTTIICVGNMRPLCLFGWFMNVQVQRRLGCFRVNFRHCLRFEGFALINEIARGSNWIASRLRKWRCSSSKEVRSISYCQHCQRQAMKCVLRMRRGGYYFVAVFKNRQWLLDVFRQFSLCLWSTHVRKLKQSLEAFSLWFCFIVLCLLIFVLFRMLM